jgi:hypothetical protein
VPTSLLELGHEIMAAVDRTGRQYGIPSPAAGTVLLQMENYLRSRAALAARHVNLLRAQRVNTLADLAMAAYVIASALREDLDSLVTAPNKLRQGGLVLLLLDNLHGLGELTRNFLLECLSTLCPLMEAPSPLRAALAFYSGRAEPGAQGYQSAVLAIRDFLKQVDPEMKVTLERFKPPQVDPLPYKQFLLHYDQPLVAPTGLNGTVKDPRLKEAQDDFVQLLHQAVDGIPSRLETPTPKGTLELLLRIYSSKAMGLLMEANDDNALSVLAPPTGAAGS